MRWVAVRALVLLAAGAVTPLSAYNEGVKKLEEGDLAAAVEDFERASVSGEGEVRAAALFNLALCRAREGDAIRGKEVKDETREARIARLTEAAARYRTALAVFRRIPPPAPDAEAGARAVKVRLLAVLDEIQELAREAEKEAEERALRDPPALLLALLSGERDRRREAARIGLLPGRRRRRPARLLRKAEYKARRLAEKLAEALRNPPTPPGGKTPAPAPGPAPPALPEAARKAAAPVVLEASKAMAEAESRLDGRDAKGAVEAQTRAVEKLGEAARRLVPPLPALVAKLLDDQRTLLALTKDGDPALLPAEEGEIGTWLAFLSGLPDPPAGAKGALSAETLGKVRAAAGVAREAAVRAERSLAARAFEKAVPDEEKVIEKLEAIRDLLPKPPEPPAERVRRLLEAEREVRKKLDAIAGLGPEARKAEEKALVEPQRGHGREATETAKELERSPGEKEKEAAKKVREAEEEIFTSAESLERDRGEEARGSVDRAVKALEEALRILSGKRGEGGAGRPRNRPSPPKEGGKKKEGERKKQREAPGRLGPREARRMIAEMDRRRREEEEKLFPGGGGPRVDKDW